MEEIYVLIVGNSMAQFPIGYYSSYSLAEEAFGLYLQERLEVLYKELDSIGSINNEIAKVKGFLKTTLADKDSFTTLTSCKKILGSIEKFTFLERVHSRLFKMSEQIPKNSIDTIDFLHSFFDQKVNSRGTAYLKPRNVYISRNQINEKVSIPV
jgi:hypothetical protein